MSKIKTFILLIGDIAVLYGSLALTMVLRYGTDNFSQYFLTHIKPFSLIFVFWLLIFYLADLYKEKNLRVDFNILQTLTFAIFISITGSIILFYLFPSVFELTPKTNLAILALVFTIIDLSWRFTLSKIFISGGLKTRIVFIGDSPITNEIKLYLQKNPQIGYDVIPEIEDGADMVIIQPNAKNDPKFIDFFYELLAKKIAVIDSIKFYETIFQKLPIEEIERGWFIERITTHRQFYEFSKRITDIILSVILGVIFLPIGLIIAILTKLSSRKGPVIFRQERVGLNNKNFTLIKFGTMKADQGDLWTNKNDDRHTTLGKVLNHTHLDEIPQLYNILKGDISFIGPRAERKELAEMYRQIPHYEIRHMIKPGLTGWAQLNYKASASVEEAKEKLKYDIYYIKNRSLILDFIILLKTAKYFFFSQK
ncbi:MAG: sugar transferase [Candidatus Paceibacterota bacterium]